MNEEHIPTEEPTQESQKKQDKRNYWKGFWISLLGNGIVAVISLCSGVGFGFWGAILFLVNILIVIYLYWKNKKAFQGMVAGFALGFLITIIGGVFLVAICLSIAETMQL